MEFLIILFIAISIISSITRNIKKHTKRESNFDPWSFDSGSFDGENYQSEQRQKGEKEIFNNEKELEAEISLADKQINKPKTELESQASENIGLHYQEEIKSSITSAYQDSNQEDIKLGKPGKMEKELKTLLTGNKLPLGIIVSEVLGPPRSLKPHSYRKK